MAWCSDPTSGAHGGIGCTKEPALCWDCHYIIVQEAIRKNTEDREKGEEARYKEYKKDAMLEAIEFANWYSRWIGNHGGGPDAVFFYDKWVKEKNK